MEVRAIQPSEYDETRKIQVIAFAERDTADEAPPVPDVRHATYRAAFDNGGPRACLEVFRFPSFLNGEQVGMAGIGGVATLPEARRKGFVRALFRYTLEEARGNGDVVSYLFPFSHVFYRKFGYESCMVKQKIRVPLSAFSGIGGNGFATLIRPGDDESAIRALYRAYAENQNLMTLRSEEKWKRRLGRNPYTERAYTYLWRAGSGKPLAYVSFHAEDADGKAVMNVEELVWSGAEGLRGILGFLGGFTARYETLVYRAPEYFPARLLLPEPYVVESRAECSGMGRIVDAARALQTLKLPAGETFRIRVHDDFLSWNDGCFLLSCEGATHAEKTEAEPDMETDIRTLAQLVCGFASAEDCLDAGTVELNGHRDLAFRMFCKKRVFLIDEF